MQTRRETLKHSAAVAGLLASTGLFPQYAQAFEKAAFDAKSVADALKAYGGGAPTASDAVTLTAPDIAENGAVVPISVTSNVPGTEKIAILVEKNPNPLSARITLPAGTEPTITTRVKMAGTSNVHALVQANGKWLIATKEIKVTLGGCGG